MLIYFSVAASEEIAAAFKYFEQQQSGLGFRFIADVDEALARKCSQPLACGIHPVKTFLAA
jgi:hypothetical protein